MSGRVPTLAQAQQLYAATKKASARFAGYNFHAYFLRRADEAFAPALASLGDTSTIPGAKAGAANKMSDEELARWYAERSAALPAVERAGETNALYKGEKKLVVEMRHGPEES